MNKTGTKKRTTRWQLLAAGAACVVASLGIGTMTGFVNSHSEAANKPATIQPTKAQLVELRNATATPFQREQIVEKMQAAFAGIAQVGVGDMPNHPTPAKATQPSSTPTVQTVVALGITRDHFWITASYGDMARGAIWGAVGVCVSNGVPSYLCSSAGWLLTTWSQGWGSANNHGVWAAIYWWPPHVTGGRW